MAGKGDLLDLLDVMTASEDPTTEHPHVRDIVTGEDIGGYDRCPDCGVMGYGPCYPNRDDQRRTFRTAEGWLVLGSCNCGRLRYRALQRRDGDYWLNHAPSVWGPIVPTPDTAAWMTGQVRAEVLT